MTLRVCPIRWVRSIAVLGGRVPPRVEQEAVVGFGQVQPEPAGLEADQEHRVGAVLEAPQHRGPVPRLAVQVAVPDASRVEPLADVGEEPGELAEDESTVPARGHILDLIEQRVDLAAGQVRLRAVDQRGVQAELAQPVRYLQSPAVKKGEIWRISHKNNNARVRYQDKQLSVDFDGVDVSEITTEISRVTSVNISLARDVKGMISAHFQNLPLGKALSTIYEQQGWAVEKMAKSYYVAPNTNANQNIHVDYDPDSQLFDLGSRLPNSRRSLRRWPVRPISIWWCCPR